MTRERGTDTRDYDQTSLGRGGHGAMLHRDYTAHFFRWCFVERFTRMFNKDNAARVLEIGCGPERPLPKIMCKSKSSHPAYYLGVDLNNVKYPDGKAWEFYRPGFNFVERYDEIAREEGPFDVAVHLEVFEHMQPAHGREMLRGVYRCLRPGGYMLMSTPCYNGKWQAKNHIHEYGIDELAGVIRDAGFDLEDRFGTFANIPDLRREAAKEPETKAVWDRLSRYYSYDALSCIFAPMFPDHARNNLWVCKKPEKTNA